MTVRKNFVSNHSIACFLGIENYNKITVYINLYVRYEIWVLKFKSDKFNFENSQIYALKQKYLICFLQLTM